MIISDIDVFFWIHQEFKLYSNYKTISYLLNIINTDAYCGRFILLCDVIIEHPIGGYVLGTLTREICSFKKQVLLL